MRLDPNETMEAKRWRLAKLHLEYARDAIPKSTGVPLGSGGARELALLGELARFLARDALEDALEVLRALGDLNNCRGGFWRDLMKSADYLDLITVGQALRVRFHQALASIVTPTTDGTRESGTVGPRSDGGANE